MQSVHYNVDMNKVRKARNKKEKGGNKMPISEKVRMLEKENEELKIEISHMKQFCGDDCKLKKMRRMFTFHTVLCKMR